MPRIRIIGNLPIARWGQTTLTSTLPPEEDFGITPEQQEYFNKLGARVVENKKRGLYDVTSKDRTYGMLNPRGEYEAPPEYADTTKPKNYSTKEHYLGPDYYAHTYGVLNKLFNTGISGYTGKGLIGPSSRSFISARKYVKPKTSKQVLNEWKGKDFYQESPYNEMMRKQQNSSPIQSPFDIQRQQDMQNMYSDKKDYSMYAEYGGSLPQANFGTSVTTTTTIQPQMTNPFEGTGFQKSAQKFLNTGLMKGFDSVANTISGSINLAAPYIDFFNQRNIQRDINRQAQEDSIAANQFETRPAAQTGNKGDWDINKGIFRANEIGFKSKGQFVNPMYYPNQGMGYSVKHGGAIDETRKIRIRIIEDGDLNQMAAGGQISGYRGGYSGQYGYGLNLNQKKVYTDMPENKSEQYSNTLQPVDRDKANIEAEKHEVAWGDVDADGAVEAMNIGGKRHEQGGTPLSVPEGTFIFSDAKDLAIKDENTLKMFGLSPKKQGYTPAEIAKRYDTNKYKAIIEDPASDEIRKATAQLMVKSYFKKLAQLALIQEQMKGFPQGIPEMAKRYLPELAALEQEQMPEQTSQQTAEEEMPQEGQEQMMPEEAMMPEEGSEEMPSNMQMPQQRWGGSYNYGGDVFGDGGSYYYAGGGYVATNQGTAVPGTVAGATVSTKTKAPLTDPEYNEFLTLLATIDPRRGRSGNKYRVSSIPSDKIDRFLYLVDKFGFNRGPEGGKPGHSITQGSTTGYSYQANVGGKNKTLGFFTGLTPQQFEKKLLVDLVGQAEYDKMTPEQRTKMYFEELGIDENSYTSRGLSLSDPKTLYTNKDFFENIFYPAFAKNFTGADYRDLGDDKQLGMDHYDSYMKRVRTTPTTTAPVTQTAAFVCNNGNVEKYDVNKHGTGVTTYPSYQEASTNCVNTPNELKPGTTRPPMQTRPFKTDVMNLALAGLVPPNKYYPWMAKLPFEPTDVAFKDWRAKAAERQSLYGKMANQLNQYSPGAATASNLSFLAGQQAEGLIGDIDQVDADNVAIANQYAQSEQARKDKVMAANVGSRDEYIDQLNTLSQNYDNALRGYYSGIGQAGTTLSENQLKALLINAAQDRYQFDPWTSQTSFIGGGKGWGDLGAASGGDWKSLGDDYRSAQQEIPGITPDVWRQIKFGKQQVSKYGGRVSKPSMTDIAKMLQGGYSFPF